MIDEYVDGLKAAGFASVEVIDTKKDLNAYAQVEGQSACCPPPMKSPVGTGLTVVSSESCCEPTNVIHSELAELFTKYDVNEFAASVQVYAVKPS